MTRTVWAAAAAAAVGLAGCGPEDGLDRVPVSGTLTAHGKPVEGALVRFIPAGATKGYGATGRTDPGGGFTLADARGMPGGVVPGEYKVSVSRMVRPDGSALPLHTTELDFPDAKETMPRRVVSADNTPLTFTVTGPTDGAAIDVPAALFAEKRGKGRDDGP